MPSRLPHAGEAPGDHTRRIPSLDGLRAISIIFVILAHSSVTRGFPQAVFRLTAPFDLGNLGVRVFFAISGYLITHLLLVEHRRHGRINLPHFYVRRVFRIFPAYFTYIGIVLLAGLAGLVTPLNGKVLAHLATFTLNYASEGTYAVAHFWSLGVEEQFYVLWPPLLAWVGLRGSFRAALVFVILSPLLRLALYVFVPSSHAQMSTAFHTVGDAIAMGCLLARWRDDLWSRESYRRLMTSAWFALVPIAAVAITLVGGRPRIYYGFAVVLEMLAIVLVLDWCIRFPGSRAGRVLNSRAFAWVGTLSYSLYVWQELYLDSHYTSPWLRFPLNVFWGVASGIASYYMVEQPALRLRSRLERRKRAARAAQPEVKAAAP